MLKSDGNYYSEEEFRQHVTELTNDKLNLGDIEIQGQIKLLKKKMVFQETPPGTPPKEMDPQGYARLNPSTKTFRDSSGGARKAARLEIWRTNRTFR